MNEQRVAVVTGVTLPVDAGWLVAQTYDAYPAAVEGADAAGSQPT